MSPRTRSARRTSENADFGPIGQKSPRGSAIEGPFFYGVTQDMPEAPEMDRSVAVRTTTGNFRPADGLNAAVVTVWMNPPIAASRQRLLWIGGRVVFYEGLQRATTTRMTQLSQSPGLDLADALPGNA